LSAAALFWGVAFSSLGMGFFLYGRKQSALVPLVCGLALMIVPYLLGNTLALVLVGMALTVIPWFLRI